MTDTGHVYVSIGLAMATIIAAMGIMKARADQQQPAYLVIGTSPNPKAAQTITAVRYDSRIECDAKVTKIVLHDTGPRQVTVTVAPHCTDQRPAFWVE